MAAKTILLMRHAKSSWADSSMKDFDRPLNSRGREDAPKMGRYLKELGLIPDQIFCSSAARTTETGRLVTAEMNFDYSKIHHTRELYSGDPKAYLECILESNPESDCVMVIGHNPMTEQLVSVLDDGDQLHQMSTAAIACFRSDAESWAGITPENCSLKWKITPKQLSEK